MLRLVGAGPHFLPFERAYALEWDPCPRCAGSGRTAHANPRMANNCWNCRGLGRRISRAGRDLWKEICRELGRPVAINESRIDPTHLNQVMVRDLRVGMCVGAIYPERKPRKIITSIEHLQLGQVRVTFEGRSQAVFSVLDSVSRELTPAELDQVETLMADRLGAGAVAVASPIE